MIISRKRYEEEVHKRVYAEVAEYMREMERELRELHERMCRLESDTDERTSRLRDEHNAEICELKERLDKIERKNQTPATTERETNDNA